MDYLKITEVSQKWDISCRRLQTLCAQGKIEGAVRFGKVWMIPKNCQKPLDRRTKQGKAQAQKAGNMPFPRQTPFLHMSDLYRKAGDAELSIEALSYNHEAQTLLAAEIAYSRGQIEKVYESAYYLLHKNSDFYAVISAGMILALCAIWRGDLNMWRQAKIHIAEAPAKTDADRDIMAFSITAVDSMLYDVSSFPNWFKIGRFESLHRDALPAAKVFYAKYLFADAYAVATKQVKIEGYSGLSLMSVTPFTVEPMISQAQAESSIVAEIYLRLICATVYNNIGNEKEAIYHIDRAIELALPDRLFGLLAEYCRTLYALLEARICLVDKQAWEIIKPLYKVYNEGWSKLSGLVRGRNIITTLSVKQREVAKLAAFGMKNKQIAEKLHMSMSAVKQAINDVSNKTGMPREDFAAIL